jgi:hypothetical protein
MLRDKPGFIGKSTVPRGFLADTWTVGLLSPGIWRTLSPWLRLRAKVDRGSQSVLLVPTRQSNRNGRRARDPRLGVCRNERFLAISTPRSGGRMVS